MPIAQSWVSLVLPALGVIAALAAWQDRRIATLHVAVHLSTEEERRHIGDNWMAHSTVFTASCGWPIRDVKLFITSPNRPPEGREPDFQSPVMRHGDQIQAPLLVSEVWGDSTYYATYRVGLLGLRRRHQWFDSLRAHSPKR